MGIESPEPAEPEIPPSTPGEEDAVPDEPQRSPAEPSPPPVGSIPDESSPIIYEAALDTARKLRASGVENPFDFDPDTMEGPGSKAREMIGDWERSQSFDAWTSDNLEQAQSLVQVALFWIEAGFTHPSVFETALERLRNAHVDALCHSYEPIASFLRQEIQKVEIMSGIPNPEQSRAEEINERYKLAEEAIRGGQGLEAYRILMSTTATAKYRGMGELKKLDTLRIKLLDEIKKKRATKEDPNIINFDALGVLE